MQKKVGLYWFSHDLRLNDNDLLANAAQQVDALVCVYCMPELTPYLANFSQQSHLGEQRVRFIQSSINDLSKQLAKFDQKLILCDQEPFAALQSLIQSLHVTHLYCDRFSGTNEARCVEALQQQFPQLCVVQANVSTLFSESQLPFALDDLPPTFTRFRKQVEALPIHHHANLTALPPMAESDLDYFQHTSLEEDEALFVGGSTAGHQHCAWYFSTHLASEYKLTRNGLDGKEYSTKFSPWLALGCVSPREVMTYLRDYEAKHGANESSYWIYFELLWREYFHWYAQRHAERLFLHQGIKAHSPIGHFDSARFHSWVKGETGLPIVDACMRQLKLTGYLSNRGRQLVASCLIHELDLDWRYGAAYFETKLIDYDVGSNWGNWQYLAGVGADPNPSRKFNLEKQTQMYDPNGEFVAKWLSAATGKESH
ncbi:DASH family cryptochrome [Vibrio sinaloensis]|uniref:DASH family cryptochrome n=1 Tax=Photobacterium sp. (strain ATCC 43367) TaxID=379097 RepID=UPI00206C9F0A|nr:DASH family cryptochrome [Vibrio sinaloensis]UPQ89528.1 DASH family cryptochrome [Vibrio sinaloensis]